MNEDTAIRIISITIVISILAGSVLLSMALNVVYPYLAVVAIVAVIIIASVIWP
ncbi:MAG: hypothetical protein QW478_04970 [Candidatus Micrarchaeaceae archaeon]